MSTDASVSNTTPSMWSREVITEDGPHGPVLHYAVRPPSLSAVLAASVDRWPDRVHLVQGDRRLTFAEHAEAVDRAAQRLLASGVTPGDRVGILAAISPAWVAALWACWRIGAIAVPLNWSWTAEQVGSAIEDCTPTLVVVDVDREDRVPESKRLPVALLDDMPVARLDLPAVDERSLGLIIYTSGTTDRPKGATFTHGAIVASLQNALAKSGRFPDEIRVGSKTPVSLLSYPVFHLAGVNNVIISTSVGVTLVFGGTRFDAAEVVQLIQRERVTAWGAVPTMLQRAVDVLKDRPADVSSLRAITVGGAPMPPGLADDLAIAFPSVRGHVANAYGMTETGGTVTLVSGTGVTDDPTCVGQPMPVVEIAIDSPLPEEPGEVLVRTSSSMTGYWGRDASPIDADGWLHSGDVGYVDGEGFLHIVDRIKDIIIRGGENISPSAVEEGIRSHPDVAEVAVFSVPDPGLGETVAAIVVITGGPGPDEDELRAYARKSLAGFEVPDHWWIRTEPLARGTMDKVLRRALRDEFLARSVR